MAQLYYYYAAMGAGKSTALLQTAYNYRERGMTVLLLTAAIDDRYQMGKINSRIGLHSDAQIFNADSQLFELIQSAQQQSNLACVLIDEAQFLSEAQVWQLSDVVDRLDIAVLCYGLRTDFRGELFPGSKVLLAISEKLTELKTICHCGRKAMMVLRLDQHGQAVADGEQIEIGGNERYVSVCRRHFKTATKRGAYQLAKD